MSQQLNENLCFNDANIDAQHQTILEQYNLLSQAVQEGNSVVIIDKLTKFLQEYTGEHFASEDLIMFKYRYPHRHEHRQQHEEFEREVNNLKSIIQQEGVSRNVAVTATGVLYRYIVNHINKSDMDLANYIREHNTSSDSA